MRPRMFDIQLFLSGHLLRYGRELADRRLILKISIYRSRERGAFAGRRGTTGSLRLKRAGRRSISVR